MRVVAGTGFEEGFEPDPEVHPMFIAVPQRQLVDEDGQGLGRWRSCIYDLQEMTCQHNHLDSLRWFHRHGAVTMGVLVRPYRPGKKV